MNSGSFRPGGIEQEPVPQPSVGKDLSFVCPGNHGLQSHFFRRGHSCNARGCRQIIPEKSAGLRCNECNFDICAACVVRKDLSFICPGHHGLQSHVFEPGHRCNASGCRKVIDKGRVGLRCDECHFDTCTVCVMTHLKKRVKLGMHSSSSIVQGTMG